LIRAEKRKAFQNCFLNEVDLLKLPQILEKFTIIDDLFLNDDELLELRLYKE
jgi:hypothetical protein